MSNQKIIRYFTIMIMMNVFLPIVALQLNFIVTGFMFNLFLFHVFVFIKAPNFFFIKPLRYVYIFLLIYFFLMYIGHYDITMGWIYGNLISIYLSILIFTYYIWSGDYQGLKIVILFTLVFIAITCITSSIGNYIYPYATRYLYGVRDNFFKIKHYESIGIARYAFFSGLPMVIPVVFFQYKTAIKKNKIYIGLLIVLIIISSILASITAPVLLVFVALFLSFIGMKRLKKNLIIITLTLIMIVIIPKSFYSNIFYGISNLTTNKIFEKKIYDIGFLFEHKINFSALETTSVEYRLERYVTNLSQFVDSPIIGKGYVGNYHIFWLNILAQFGLVGLFPIILVMTNQMKYNIKLFNKEFVYYYLLSIIIFVALGFMKAIVGREIYLYLYFIVPGIYFINYKERIK